MVFILPRPSQTWLEHALSKDELKSEILSVPISAIGLGIDTVLLVIPVVAVVGLQLPIKRKIGILIIFMFGIL